MKEVKLSPSYVHNSVSLIISGVCLLFHNGNIADVLPEICVTIISMRLCIENMLGFHGPRVKTLFIRL